MTCERWDWWLQCVCWDVVTGWRPQCRSLPVTLASCDDTELIGLIEIHRQEESPLTSSAAPAACLEEINLITRSVRRRDCGLAPISILMICAREAFLSEQSSPITFLPLELCFVCSARKQSFPWYIGGIMVGKHTLHSGNQVSDICLVA